MLLEDALDDWLALGQDGFTMKHCLKALDIDARLDDMRIQKRLAGALGLRSYRSRRTKNDDGQRATRWFKDE